MKTLIIPCGKRNLINGIPMYLNRHPKGMLLFERCMSGIHPEKFDRIIAVLLQEDIDRYFADQVLLTEFSHRYPFEVVALPAPTSGPADTVCHAISVANVVGSVVVKDVDNYVQIPEKFSLHSNFIAGLDLIQWNRDIHNLRSKSFLLLNEQGNILDIIEKQFKSDVICLGLYGFHSAEDFVYAYKKLNDPSYPISNLYLSHIISYLIGYSKKVFRYVPAAEFENWGDNWHWCKIQQDYGLYFINLDEELNFSKVLALQQRGASLVGYTVTNADAANQKRTELENSGIHLLGIICDCPQSTVRMVLDSDLALDYMNYDL